MRLRSKLWKPFLDLVISNDTLTQNTRNFLSYFCNIFAIKLPQNYIMNMYFHRLNYDVLAFTSKIRITTKDTLLPGNFSLCLKHWKSEMCRYNLLLKHRKLFMIISIVSTKCIAMWHYKLFCSSERIFRCNNAYACWYKYKWVTPSQAETQLHSLERATAGIGLHVNAHKTEYMCFNQTGDISTLDGCSLKLVDKFTYLGSSVSSTEKDIDTWLTKAWTAIDRLSVIWKSDLTDEMKRNFFQAAVVSILLYGCTTWTHKRRMEKKLDGNYTRLLRAILNKSWRQHPTKHQLNGHLPPITKTIQVRRTWHTGHCWRSRDELISDVLPWTPSYGRAEAGRPARTYIQQLSEDTGYSPEGLPEAMNDKEWRERVSDIRAGGTTWWWNGLKVTIYL